ncbi:MAG TPA: FecR family protein, partial [Puia sp.]|nr:FecR family protein [Puia sp.]
MEQPGYIRDLFEKHMRGTASVAEQEQLSEVLERYSNEELTDVLESIAASTGRDSRFSSGDWETVLQSILQHPRETSDVRERTGSYELSAIRESADATQVPQEKALIIRLYPRRRFAAAAIILLVVLGAGLYAWLGGRPSKEAGNIPVARFKNDVLPGGDKAVLTLANGAAIVLDSAQSGVLAQQGNAKVVKLNNGQLAYQAVTSHQSQTASPVTYNTLSTPRGGQYQLTLPDGTKVWLNAASSIHYPTAFSGKERRVEIRGEAYFEVAKDPYKPFKVVSLAVAGKSALEIAVLGTRFNVNTYEDETIIKTSLLEGRVSVNGSRPLQ